MREIIYTSYIKVYEHDNGVTFSSYMW